jgi:hypothetical protein
VEAPGIESSTESAPVSSNSARPSTLPLKPVCETLDTTEGRLLDKIADAELAGRTVLVEALERRLVAHRRGRSAMTVVDLSDRRRGR